MMRVLHISKYYHPFIGGIEQVAHDCVEALKDEAEQKVICFNHMKGTVLDVLDDVEIIRVGCQAKVSSQSLAISYGNHLKKVIKNFKPDVVIFHYPNPFVAHYLEKYRKNKKFKLIIYWHLDITKQKILGKLFDGQNKRIIKMADYVVGATPIHINSSKYYEYFKNKSCVLPYAINESRLKMSFEEKEKASEIKKIDFDKTICFAMGRHVPYKGMEYLIKVSKLLDDRFKFYIAGSGPLTDNLKQSAKDDKKVIFLGKIDDSTWRSYVNACDIFCFPSVTRNEAFGLALAEAMYFKKPAVTFHIDGSGVNYVGLNGITCIECENGNVESFKSALLKLSGDQALRHSLGESGHDRVVSMFTFDSFKSNLKALIEK